MGAVVASLAVAYIGEVRAADARAVVRGGRAHAQTAAPWEVVVVGNTDAASAGMGARDSALAVAKGQERAVGAASAADGRSTSPRGPIWTPW